MKSAAAAIILVGLGLTSGCGPSATQTGAGGDSGSDASSGADGGGTGGSNPAGTGGSNPAGTGGSNPAGTGGNNPAGTGGADAGTADAKADAVATSDATTSPDGGGNPDGGPQIGPPIMLPLRAASDAGVFNHSAEATIAAHAGTVAAAYISMAFDETTSFQTANVIRGGTLAVSHDDGTTWSDAIPMAGAQPTDPVVRVGRDGTFFAASLDWATINSTAVGSLQRSTDGDHWTTLATDIPNGDKEWIAVDDANRRVLWGSLSALVAFDFDGNTQATALGSGAQMANALVTSGGALFVTLGFDLLRWDGTVAGTPMLGATALPGGATGMLDTDAGTGLGLTADGRVWLLRTIIDAGIPRVVLRVWDGAVAAGGQDVAMSTPGAYAFMPAGATDAAGRLHAVWYEDGALVWTMSATADPMAGFAPPTVIDSDACPAGGFIPTIDTSSGGRRLREYIDLAADGARVHVIWTHAPDAPSRVYTTTIRP